MRRRLVALILLLGCQFVSEYMLGSRYPVVVRARNWRATFTHPNVFDMHLLADGREVMVRPGNPIRGAARLAQAQYEKDCRWTAALANEGVPAAAPPPPHPDEVRALRALGYAQ